MKTFYTLQDEIDNFLEMGWTGDEDEYGRVYTADGKSAEGYVRIWGDGLTYAFMDTDVTFRTEQMERQCTRERGIQISFVDDMTSVYYRKKADSQPALPGVFSFVINVFQPWFHYYPAGARQKVSTLFISERFFTSHGIDIPDEFWDTAAFVINNNHISFPEIGLICKQIKNCSMDKSIFPQFLQAKALEASSYLFDYAVKHDHEGSNRLTQRSRNAAKEAMLILNKSFAEPATIDQLAKTVGVDKKTLQTAFRQIVGTTIAEYTQSLRMEKALTYLEGSTLSIEEIAHAVGYLGKANFYTAFEKTYGFTPHEMRKRISRF